jgi:hypothetical protein
MRREKERKTIDDLFAKFFLEYFFSCCIEIKQRLDEGETKGWKWK